MKPTIKLALILVALVLPYIGLVSYWVIYNPEVGDLPNWVLLSIGGYFIFSIVVFALSARYIRRQSQQGTQALLAPGTSVGQSMRSIKRLLVIYLLTLPIDIVAVFVQKEIPVTLAVLAVAVPGIVLGILWCTTIRNRNVDSKV